MADYLSTNAGNTQIAAMLGGPVALPDSMIEPLGEAISLPDRWNYTSVQPGNTAATAPLTGGVDPDVTPAGPTGTGVPGTSGSPVTATR